MASRPDSVLGVLADYAHVSARPRQSGGQDAQQRRLAGAVAAEQACDAGAEFERHAVERCLASVGLGQLVDVDVRLVKGVHQVSRKSRNERRLMITTAASATRPTATS